MEHNPYVYRPRPGERYFVARIASSDARFCKRELYIGCDITPVRIETMDLLYLEGREIPFFGGDFFLDEHPGARTWYRVALSFEPVARLPRMDKLEMPKTKKEELIYEW